MFTDVFLNSVLGVLRIMKNITILILNIWEPPSTSRSSTYGSALEQLRTEYICNVVEASVVVVVVVE